MADYQGSQLLPQTLIGPKKSTAFWAAKPFMQIAHVGLHTKGSKGRDIYRHRSRPVGTIHNYPGAMAAGQWN